MKGINPNTRLGKWSAGLTLAFLLFIILKMLDLMPLMTFAITALGLAGFVLGVVAIFKHKEKSILTMLSIPIGLMIIIWIGAEILYPH